MPERDSRTEIPLSLCFSGIEEEGLLLEETLQTADVEIPPEEELPAELPPPELPEVITLPEPPVEIEASGSGTGDLDDLLPPSTPAAAEEETSLEETASEDVLIPEDAGMDAGDISEKETEEVEVEVAAVEEEHTAEDVEAPEEEHLDEVVVNEAEIPEELEISTISTETTEEEGLPAVLPTPDAVDVVSEASEPEAAETALLPVGEDPVNSVEDSNLLVDEEVNAEQPEEDSNVVLSHSEEPVLEEGGMEAPTESEVQEVIEETPAVVEGGPEAPQISTEDLTEDEILIVNQDEQEPSVTDSLSPIQPTVLSPEKDSPFTRISEIEPASDGQPDIIIPTLVEVKQKNDTGCNVQVALQVVDFCVMKYEL